MLAVICIVKAPKKYEKFARWCTSRDKTIFLLRIYHEYRCITWYSILNIGKEMKCQKVKWSNLLLITFFVQKLSIQVCQLNQYIYQAWFNISHTDMTRAVYTYKSNIRLDYPFLTLIKVRTKELNYFLMSLKRPKAHESNGSPMQTKKYFRVSVEKVIKT